MDVDDELRIQRTMKDGATRLKARINKCKNDEKDFMSDSCRSSLGATLRNKGHAALKKGRLQLAVNFYTQAIAQEDALATVLSYRAIAYLKLQRYQNAIDDCTEIIDLQPKFWKAFALRAEAFREQKQFGKAIVDLQQAKKLHPTRTNIFDKLRCKCKREVDTVQRLLHITQLTEEAKKLPARPYVKGDKRFTMGHHILRMHDCLVVIARILDEPGYGVLVWKEYQSDRWKKVWIMDQYSTKGKEKSAPDYDFLIVVNRLEELRSILKEVRSVGRQALALAQGFPTLLGSYDYHEQLVLEIIFEVCRYGDDIILRALLHAQPLPTFVRGLQANSQSVRTNSLALLDLAATVKPQQVLTLLMKKKLFHLILKSMHSGSVVQHESSVNLFFKLVLDPRMRRHLLTLPSDMLSEELCGGLIRACRADRPMTRMYGSQAITVLLEHNKSKREKCTLALVHPGSSGEKNLPENDNSDMSMLTMFVDGGVLAAAAELLSRESERAPEKIEDYAPSIWEDDVELICERIGETVSEFSEFHECTLRNFDFLSGYVQVAMVNAIRAVDYMADNRRAVEVLEKVRPWGSFVTLLSSFPHPLATLTVQVLAKLCQKDKRVSVHLSNLWPESASLILMELARSAQRLENWPTHQAAMLVLGKLAWYKSFLNVVQDPTSFTILVSLLEVGRSTTAVNAGCTCLAIAILNCEDCMELAELHASSLVKSLLGLWCEFKKEEQVKFQIEELLYILMKRSGLFQEAVLMAFKNGKLTGVHITVSESHKLLIDRPSEILALRRTRKDDHPILSYQEFVKTGINFHKVVDFLSTLVRFGKFQPSSKFADLCAGPGVLSIQLAKQFKEVHCFAVNCKQALVEHTKRLAKHESLQNLTSVLSKGLDLLPQALPSRVDVAILCLSLQGIHDLGHLFQALNMKLLPRGKLVLIDGNDYLVDKAIECGISEGFNVMQQPRLFEQYSVVVLEKSKTRILSRPSSFASHFQELNQKPEQDCMQRTISVLKNLAF